MTQTYIRLLTIAGSDSGGGAGIQADLKTFMALGAYGMSVCTAMTAQNTCGVRSVHPLPPQFVADQLKAVLEDIGTDAIKIGMLYSSAIIRSVAGVLREFKPTKIVLDPVMIAKGGDPLLLPEAILALKEELLPLVDVVTPNLPEAEALTGRPVHDRASREAAAKIMAEQTGVVVLKGGHAASTDAEDLIYTRDGETRWVSRPRIDTRNTHGTGCTFSAAIAAYAGRGLLWPEAVEQAREYLQNALLSGSRYVVGKGHGPVDHAWSLR